MPRRTKIPELPNYDGLPQKSEILLVQKSTPLQSLSRTGLSLVEFKILDAYLSRIDSHNPDIRHVKLGKGELEKLLGVTRISRDELKTRLQGLFRTVTIEDKRKNGGMTIIGLFERAEATLDDDGQWQIDLTCTVSAMEYIFNIENLGYLRYRLKNIIALTSRYSYILYLYLESNRYRSTWEIPLEKLKQLLNCNGESYDAFKVFNDRVLKKSREELISKTDIQYTYEPIKNGRKVARIRFTVQSFGDGQQIPAADVQQSIAIEEAIKRYGSESLAELAQALDYEFTREQMEKILAILARIDIQSEAPTSDINCERARYLRRKYDALNIEDAKKTQAGQKINSRFAYFKKMLEGECSTT